MKHLKNNVRLIQCGILILDMINIKIEEDQGIFNEKFETVLRSKEIVEEKKNIYDLANKVSILLESVENQVENEKKAKKTQL